jgi:hypothetical protein
VGVRFTFWDIWYGMTPQERVAIMGNYAPNNKIVGACDIQLIPINDSVTSVLVKIADVFVYRYTAAQHFVEELVFEWVYASR